MILTLLKPARNVVQLYGLCTNAWDGRVRLVLELCVYGNVREYVKAMPRDKVIRVTRNAVNTLWWAADGVHYVLQLFSLPCGCS